jgi:uncharacterized protein YqcC (DUF446 family)
MPSLAAPDDASARRTAIAHYLRYGDHGATSPAWPGNAWERGVPAHNDVMQALVAEVNKLAGGHQGPAARLPADVVAFTIPGRGFILCDMKKKPASKLDAQEVHRALQRVILAMKAADLWDVARPKDESFTDMGAFGQRTMSFAQWLRWVFVPNVEKLVASDGPWPKGSSVAVIATREGDTDHGIHSLVESLSDFDSLFER